MGQGRPQELMSIFIDRLRVGAMYPKTAVRSGGEIAQLSSHSSESGGMRCYPDGRALRV
jgi:hypothetical protein